ncbi:MAG: RHS repeat-associated core domain-containing protein, partial [Myxococcales bacterium]|nr:RHS repeat-associated core domain-containing protein [Myxococcales bacterium]
DASLGVVSRGGGCGACARDAGHFGAPCGATCEGDEFYVQSDYTRAADAWILGLLVRQAAAAVLDSAQAKVVEFFYDGPDFTGLAAGQATLGQLMRKRFQLDDRTWIDAERRRYDEHGNVVESVATAGTPGQGGHRILTTYDDEGLLVTANELTLDGYSVRSEQQYDPIWGAVNQASGPRVYVDGRAVTPEHQTRLVYDDLGHLVSRANPGDPADRPTATFEFEYGAPVSRVVSHFRSVRGAAQPDRRTIECQDGFGRTTAQLVDVGGEYVVGGYQVANRLGAVVVSHLVSTTRNDNCLLAEPDRAATRMRYDALGRLIGTTRDDADLYGQASRTLNTFEPLVRHRYLPDDTDPNDPRADTPVTQIFDGLGRQTAMRLRETANGEPLDFTYEFDVRGDLVQVNGPAGDVRTFERDRAGRVVAAEDADRGRSALTLDAAGNVVRSEDAEGRVVEMTYDALNRLVAEWDAADPAGTRREYLFDRPDHCPDGLCPEGALQQVGMTFPTPGGRGARWITHDDRGRLAAVTTVLDGYALSEAYTYDNLGGLLTATSPDGTVDRRTYDALGRVASIDGIADLSWTLGTLLSRTALANGVTVARTYDVLDRPATLDVTGPSGPLAQLRYGHDRLGSLTAIDDLATPADQPGRGARFTYDALDRLVSAHLDPGRAAFEEVLTYGYDRRLNLVDKRSNREGGSRSHVGALTYDADRPHAVVSAGARTYGYDDAGLMIDHNGLLVGWDAWHRPVDVERDGVVVERHWYADDRILSESATASRVFVNPNFEVEDGMALTHYHVGLDRIATVETDALAADVLGDLAPLEGGVPAPDGAFDTGDAVVAALAEGGSVALPAGAHHASVRTMLRGSVRSRLLAGEPRTTFIHSDATRSRFLETDADGQVLARHATDPHGLDRQGPAGRGFEGRRTDTATGLVRMGARSFDPWLGRWTSPDPEFTFGDSPLELSSPGEGSDPYGLLASNPVGRTDPSGRSAELAAALDRASVSPNYNLGQLARPGVTAETFLDFAFNDNYVEMQAAVKETVQQLSTQLTRDLEDARFNLQGEELMLAALQEPNLGNEVSESTIADNIRRVGEAKAAVKAQELRLAEFEIGRRAVARNVAAVQKAYRYRVNNGATRADLRPLANRSVGHFNRLHAISQAAFARAGRIASAIHRRNHSLAIKRKGQLANIKVTKQNAPAPVAKRQNSSKI